LEWVLDETVRLDVDRPVFGHAEGGVDLSHCVEIRAIDCDTNSTYLMISCCLCVVCVNLQPDNIYMLAEKYA
jgi:hypothetical protein